MEQLSEFIEKGLIRRNGEIRNSNFFVSSNSLDLFTYEEEKFEFIDKASNAGYSFISSQFNQSPISNNENVLEKYSELHPRDEISVIHKIGAKAGPNREIVYDNSAQFLRQNVLDLLKKFNTQKLNSVLLAGINEEQLEEGLHELKRRTDFRSWILQPNN